MVTLRHISLKSGFSLATVSRALKGDTTVRRETQEVIVAAASSLGYSSNPYFGNMMSSLRRKQVDTFRGNLGILWYDGRASINLEFREALHLRASTRGYKLDEFVREDQSLSSLKKILRSRGINGLVISPPSAASGKVHFKTPFNDVACVSTGWALFYPALHSVKFDHYQSMRMSMHYAKKGFGCGIAAICNLKTDRRADHVYRASFLAHHPLGPSVGSKLFLDHQNLDARKIRVLFKNYSIRCVISESFVGLPTWLLSLVPRDNMIYISDPADVPSFGWIDRRFDLLGSWAIDQVVELVQQNDFKVPSRARTILVPGQFTVN